MGFPHGAIRFDSSPVFVGENFPTADFENPERIRDAIGDYSTHTTFHNAEFEKVEKAEVPGRYGAVVEIRFGENRTTRRYRTLFRQPREVSNWAWNRIAFTAQPDLTEMGLSPEAAERHETAISRYAKDRFFAGLERSEGARAAGSGAALLAGIYESDSEGAPSAPHNDPFAIDRQWWVTLKRKLNGADKTCADPFVCPRPIEGECTPVIREGTLAEAGMKQDFVENVDAVCRRWAEEGGSGFSVCIVRHSVIAFHRSFGSVGGAAMTVETKTCVASITKLMSGTLFGTVMDQGLIDLDAPIDVYLPVFRGIDVQTPITVRHLYTHTSGLEGHWGDDMHDMEEIVALLYPTLEVGVRRRYCGAGYALGGKIVETVTGEALPQCFWNHLLEPLGCFDTEVVDSGAYAKTVPGDLVKIGQMLLNGGAYGDKRFLCEETLKKMVPERLTKTLGPDTDEVWGVGFYPVQQTGLIKAERMTPGSFGHGGATGSGLWIDPGNDLVIALARPESGSNYKAFKIEFIDAILDGIQE